MVEEAMDFYEILGVSKGCKETEVRRAYRTLITKEHPDKGGDPEKFALMQRAYDVLSSDAKRKQYDETGRADKTPDEELLDSFGGGAFRDKMREQEEERESMAEQVALREKEQSHIAGFEAWMRARGDEAQQVIPDLLFKQEGKR
ncbi:hypothetical protein CYMTET_39035 [Cymbomonas tetramitiformis]|uniref:J domain-containing protein n=1 Tax=Cymbomonas tetramitiformis TaxID=36881 RepID=A0AAE0F4N6_9CHLO|nr:hypothetical protein CYMTET_39035 [Cymbomonas tetramitiformis]